MSAEGIRVEGLEALDRDLAAMRLKVSDLDFAAIARRGARLAAGFAPKRTGKLAASLKSSKSKNRASIRAGGSRVLYAAAINYGWKKRNIEPALFLEKADDVLRREVPRELAAQVARIIRQRGLG